jgi:class I fructose-bisphosphate aldolase
MAMETSLEWASVPDISRAIFFVLGIDIEIPAEKCACKSQFLRKCIHHCLSIAEAFEYAHQLGMLTILWCYTRNNGFKVDGVDYHTSADLTGQANHLGVTLQADIIKQKLPTNNGGYLATKHGKTNPLVYEKLSTDHPIDLCRYQVLNCYSGRIGLINSGGESKGTSDMADSVYTAVINKRAGGMGLILGRKAFQRPFAEGVDILNATQDVYLDNSITIA